MEESRVLIWHRDKLKLSIITDQFLQAVFDHILGRDVVKKLMQVSISEKKKTLLNGFIFLLHWKPSCAALEYYEMILEIFFFYFVEALFKWGFIK